MPIHTKPLPSECMASSQLLAQLRYVTVMFFLLWIRCSPMSVVCVSGSRSFQQVENVVGVGNIIVAFDSLFMYSYYRFESWVVLQSESMYDRMVLMTTQSQVYIGGKAGNFHLKAYCDWINGLSPQTIQEHETFLRVILCDKSWLVRPVGKKRFSKYLSKCFWADIVERDMLQWHIQISLSLHS